MSCCSLSVSDQFHRSSFLILFVFGLQQTDDAAGLTLMGTDLCLCFLLRSSWTSASGCTSVWQRAGYFYTDVMIESYKSYRYHLYINHINDMMTPKMFNAHICIYSSVLLLLLKCYYDNIFFTWPCEIITVFSPSWSILNGATWRRSDSLFLQFNLFHSPSQSLQTS